MAASLGINVASIKVEPGFSNGQATQIKQDPDAIGLSPSAQSDDDLYEDAGDLDFTGSEQSVYLVRLPKFLWECWSKLDDDQEIKIGRIRMEGQPGDIKRMSLMLNPGLPQNRNVPKEYNLHIANKHSHNTFVFSEKDMPGYRKFQADNTPLHWINRKRVEKKKAQTSYRRAIPKQTAIRGQVQTELHCQPVENEEYDRITAKQAELAFRPKEKIHHVKDDATLMDLLNPGTTGKAKGLENFVGKTTTKAKKGQMLKTARMPENQLRDLLFALFQEYQYWPFSALKGRIAQPDAYLKETLEKIANLERGGAHNAQWQLKPEWRTDQYKSLENLKEVAPDPGPLISSFDGASDFEMDDDNIDMEEVNLG